MEGLDDHVFKEVDEEDRALTKSVCLKMLSSMGTDGTVATNYYVQKAVKDDGKPDHFDYILVAEYPGGRISLEDLQRIKDVHTARVLQVYVKVMTVPSAHPSNVMRTECGLQIITIISGKLNAMKAMRTPSFSFTPPPSSSSSTTIEGEEEGGDRKRITGKRQRIG